MKIHDLVQRYDGFMGIVTRVRKNEIVHVMIFPSGAEVAQMKRDWKVISDRRPAKRSKT